MDASGGPSITAPLSRAAEALDGPFSMGEWLGRLLGKPLLCEARGVPLALEAELRLTAGPTTSPLTRAATAAALATVVVLDMLFRLDTRCCEFILPTDNEWACGRDCEGREDAMPPVNVDEVLEGRYVEAGWGALNPWHVHARSQWESQRSVIGKHGKG